MLVFLKSYNPDTEKIKYLGKKFFPMFMTIEVRVGGLSFFLLRSRIVVR